MIKIKKKFVWLLVVIIARTSIESPLVAIVYDDVEEAVDDLIHVELSEGILQLNEVMEEVSLIPNYYSITDPRHTYDIDEQVYEKYGIVAIKPTTAIPGNNI